MLNQKKTKAIVGLEIEASSIAAAEVRSNGSAEVTRYGIAPLDSGVFREGDLADSEALSASLKDLFAEHKLARNVRLGIANHRVAVRTIQLPEIENPKELETAIRFQAHDQIPMPLEQAVLDFEVVGHSLGENGDRRINVCVVAARRDMVESLHRVLRDAGLRPVGIDLSAFGMIRALAGAAGPTVANGSPAISYEERVAQQPAGSEPVAALPATMFCHLGDVTNLAVAQGSACLFTRVSTFGIEGIAQRLAERRQLNLEHARQWLVHVGLDTPVEQVEGDPETVTAVRDVLAEGEAKLADELRLSLEYYGAQDAAAPVEEVVVCGQGTTIPGLVERLQASLGSRFSIGRPARLGHLDDAAASRLTLPYGLALEE